MRVRLMAIRPGPRVGPDVVAWTATVLYANKDVTLLRSAGGEQLCGTSSGGFSYLSYDWNTPVVQRFIKAYRVRHHDHIHLRGIHPDDLKRVHVAVRKRWFW